MEHLPDDTVVLFTHSFVCLCVCAGGKHIQEGRPQ